MKKILTNLAYLAIIVLIGFSFAYGGATFSRIKTWSTGETLTASQLNAEFNNILNNLDPTGIDDESANDAAAQATSDPYPGTSLSKATSLETEIQQLRYLIAQITGETYWYIDPDFAIADITATASEINTACDGIAATASEINTACDGITATASEINIVCDGGVLKHKVINIGDWNMDSTSAVNVAHGLTLANIRSFSVIIRHDGDTIYKPLDWADTNGDDAGYFYAGTTNMTLERRATGTFDSNGYDSTSFNRGWITIWYVV